MRYPYRDRTFGKEMRSACIALLVAGLVMACGTTHDPAPTQSVECTTGYSAQSPVTHLTAADNGRSITVHPCDVIWIVLTGSSWGFVQSSDPTRLAVVPLPLPHPLNGVESVYLAKETGTAELQSTAAIPPCAPTATCPAPEQWTVTVTVSN